MIRFFGDNIYTGKINLDEAEMGQSNLLKNMEESDVKSRPKIKQIRKKRNTFDSVNALYEGR